MFDIKAVVREIEAEGNPNFEGKARAKVANCANKSEKVSTFSTFSTFSTPPTTENECIGKLESLKIVYGEPGKDNGDDEVRSLPSIDEPIPFTDHEIAEHKIDQLKLHDDRVFVRQKLIGIYGTKRLDIVNKYFEQWRLGVEGEPQEIKQENAGRHRANTWIREEKFY